MPFEIWFEFASTYSYLTVSRAEAMLRERQIKFQWRPFLLGPIFRDQGLTTSPFVLHADKGAYMWRDLERRAARFGLPFRRPPVFPANGLRAARVMTAAQAEPWSGDFARRVFAAQFAEGRDISRSETLAQALQGCGAAPEVWLAAAEKPGTKAQLRANTDRARALGVFGAPSFVVNDELFWGDDRLEDALAWASATGA